MNVNKTSFTRIVTVFVPYKIGFNVFLWRYLHVHNVKGAVHKTVALAIRVNEP